MTEGYSGEKIVHNRAPPGILRVSTNIMEILWSLQEIAGKVLGSFSPFKDREVVITVKISPDVRTPPPPPHPTPLSPYRTVVICTKASVTYL